MFSEDLSIFTDPDGIGDTATVSGAPMHGIFERQYAEVRGVEGYYPTFLVSATDAASIEKKVTALTISGEDYKAIAKRPDGTGMTLLILEEQ